jgi:hypothetical protein
MKNYIKNIIVACALCATAIAHAQPNIAASKMIGYSNDGNFTRIINSKYGGYWLMGQITDTNFVGSREGSNALLARLDKDLNVIKARYISVGDGNSYPSEILEMPDGTVLVSQNVKRHGILPNPGAVISYTKLGYNILISKIDTGLNFLWHKEYGGTTNNTTGQVATFANGLILLPNNKIMMGIATNDTTGTFLGAPHPGAPCVLFLDTAGTVLNIKYFNLNTVNRLNPAVVDPDGVGYYPSTNSIYIRFRKEFYGTTMVRTDLQGNEIWESQAIDFQQTFTATSDAGILYMTGPQSLICDPVGLPGCYPYDGWVTRFDTTNNWTSWQTCYGQPGITNQFIQSVELGDGSFVFIGYVKKTDAPSDFDWWIVKIDSAHQIAWQMQLGGTGQDFAATILLAPTGEIIIGGTSFSNDGNLAGFPQTAINVAKNWLIKLESVLPTNDTPPNAIHALYATPLQNHQYKINIVGDNIKFPVNALLTDATGKIINAIPLGTTNNIIDLSPFAQGIYFLTAQGYKSVKLVR